MSKNHRILISGTGIKKPHTYAFSLGTFSQEVGKYIFDLSRNKKTTKEMLHI